jgi:small GTP-binding protein
MGQKNSNLKRQVTSIRKKIVVVGDGACGKTCLCIVFNKGEFPTVHIPTLFESRLTEIELDGNHIELLLWDTGNTGFYLEI